MKHPKLEPKHTIASKQQEQQPLLTTSKQWTLPPRLKPGRRPGGVFKKIHYSTSSTPTTPVSSPDHSFAPSEKRKQQNREAQRAYRERRANRLQELQGVVSTWKENCSKLQEVSNSWQRKYNFLQVEVVQQLEEYEHKLLNYKDENVRLKDKVLELEKKLKYYHEHPTSSVDGARSASVNTPPTELKCGVCTKDECLCEDIGIKSMVFQDPILQQTIENFKPMKAVSLVNNGNKKKRGIEQSSNGPLLPMFKKSKALTPEDGTLSVSPSFLSNSNFKGNNNTPDRNTTFPSASVPEVTNGCGFCSDGSTCVCRELENKCHRGPTDSENHSGIGMYISSRVSVAPPACTGKPGTCSQCELDPMSKKFCETVCKTTDQKEPENDNTHSSPCGSQGEFIPISDAYKRIKKHMVSNTSLFPANNTIPMLPVPSEDSIISQLNVKGRKVELKSVMDILRDMDKNMFA